jgi:hypothetical protein
MHVEHELRPLKLLTKFTGAGEKFKTRHDNVFAIRHLWPKSDTVLTVRQGNSDVGMTLKPIAYVNFIGLSMRGRKWQSASPLS